MSYEREHCDLCLQSYMHLEPVEVSDGIVLELCTPCRDSMKPKSYTEKLQERRYP